MFLLLQVAFTRTGFLKTAFLSFTYFVFYIQNLWEELTGLGKVFDLMTIFMGLEFIYPAICARIGITYVFPFPVLFWRTDVTISFVVMMTNKYLV